MRPASHREILTKTFPLHLLPLAPALRCYDTRRRSALVVAHPAPLAPSYLARVLLPLSYQSPNQSPPPSLSLPAKIPLAPHILPVTRTSSTGTTRAPRTPPPSRLSSGSTAARDAAPWAACSLSSVRILDTRMCTLRTRRRLPLRLPFRPPRRRRTSTPPFPFPDRSFHPGSTLV